MERISDMHKVLCLVHPKQRTLPLVMIALKVKCIGPPFPKDVVGDPLS